MSCCIVKTPDSTFALETSVKQQLLNELAPHGKLRAGLNMSNFLLVNKTNQNGDPDGVSPRMAKAIADELGVELELIPYEGPGQVADAATSDQWDIANIAFEAARAKHIAFSPAYCEIQATYLLPPGSPISTLSEVDQPGVKIAVKQRSAYDLWLTDNLKHATLIRAESLDASFTVFVEQSLDVLAGLRPKLLEQQKLMPGSQLFDQSFTAVQQSIGCQKGKPVAARYLHDFVIRSKQSGLVAALIDQFGVYGRLSVAS